MYIDTMNIINIKLICSSNSRIEQNSESSSIIILSSISVFTLVCLMEEPGTELDTTDWKNKKTRQQST